METLQQSAPPAWHPDPAGSGGLRYWDGSRWTEHVTAPLPISAPTDGFAIASLIVGVLGGFILAPIFGFIARSRIKKSGGMRSGLGLATAGIWLSVAWVAVILAIVVAALSGVFDESNAKDFHGQKRLIAAQIDRLENNIGKSGATICGQLLTESYAATFVRDGRTCEATWGKPLPRGQYQAHIDISTITISGDVATVMATEGPLHEQYTFRREAGEWRIDDLVSHR